MENSTAQRDVCHAAQRHHDPRHAGDELVVVPDSGTGELAGISGTLIITIIEGKHFYEFDYSLPAAH